MIDNPYNETILNDGFNYYSTLLTDIKNASQSIDLATYTFNNDITGQSICQQLCEAANRGVKIRLIVDGNGTPNWHTDLAKKLEQHGIQTRVHHPFPWNIWDAKRSSIQKNKLSKWLYLAANINKRDHRKMVIIDQRLAYVGSCNISNVHLPKVMGGHGWHDTVVRISQMPTQALERAFEYTWDNFPIKDRIQQRLSSPNKDTYFRLNYSRHHRRLLYKDLLTRIIRAKKRVWITNAYFIPDNYLLRSLKRAAQKQVDVCILLPQKSDFFIMPWASENFYDSLLSAGVKIYEYLPSVLHAKTLIIDNWVLVGSSNLNHRSLIHDLEVDVCLKNQSSKATIYQQFAEDLNQSEQVDINKWHKRPWYRRYIGRLALYLKYIL